MSETVGQKLKRLRNVSGLSQSNAAAMVHVQQRSWARWESGEHNVPPGILELFCIKTQRDYNAEFSE